MSREISGQLPTERSLKEALQIYGRRLLLFFSVVLINYALLLIGVAVCKTTVH